MRITCTKKLPYRFVNPETSRMTNMERFDREADQKDIEELKRHGYTVVIHRSKAIAL